MRPNPTMLLLTLLGGCVFAGQEGEEFTTTDAAPTDSPGLYADGDDDDADSTAMEDTGTDPSTTPTSDTGAVDSAGGGTSATGHTGDTSDTGDAGPNAR